MIGGSLAAAALPIGTDTDASTNGTYLYVFNQQNGSDISQSPWYEDSWATESLIGKRDMQDWIMHEVDVTAQLPRSRDMSQIEAPPRQDVFGGSVDQRSAGRFSSVCNALYGHLSDWKKSALER